MRNLLPVLLKAYPWAFRREFGAGMLEIMLADYTRARSMGRTAALFVLLATAFDALWAGLKERLNPTWLARRQRKDRRQRMKNRLEAWWRDFVHAARNLLRAPGFTVVTVTTLALAIGSNTAIFSVIDGVLIDPLPFPESDRLVALGGTAPGTDLPEEFGLGSEFFVEYSENATALEDLALFQTAQTTVRAGEHVERLFVSRVSPSLFSTLRVEPVIGRLPTEADEEGTVIVLSHWLWMEWAGGDPAVLGSAYEVSGGLRTVIGVMGPDFRFPAERTSLWVHDLVTEPVQAGGFGLNLVGRLAPGADHESLTTELASLAQRLPDRFGGSVAYARIIDQFRPVVRTLVEQRVGNVQGPLWMLMGTVGIVLLIACANVANLLIVRAEIRQRDTAVRRALGAGRGRLIGSQLAEAALLAAVGGAGGVLLAWIGVPLLVRIAPENVPGLSNVRLDTTALFFTAGVAMLAALLSGLLPAIRFSTPDIIGGVRSSRRIVAGRDQLTRNGLVVVQSAAALVLLVGAGLLLQSFLALRDVDPGYDTADIFTFQMAPDFDELGVSDGPSAAQLHYMFLDRLAALPGVESVGLVNTLPLDEGAPDARFVTERTDLSSGVEPQMMRYTFAGGSYFQTMGIELLHGSDFERYANPTGEVKVIVSRSAADLLWPGEDPLGKLLRLAEEDDIGWFTVAGVVEDVLLFDLRQENPNPMVYLPMIGHTADTWGVGTPAYVVKTARAGTIAPEIRELIHEITPSAPMYRIFTMDALAARSMAQLSFTMMTLFIAASLALILGAVGIYGTLSYVVTQRTREIGIRMALGAQAREVRRMVVSQGGGVALVGVAVGLVGALGLTRFLDSLLFGVGAVDAGTFVMMSGLMLAVALFASYMPARRASAVDPIESLRVE